MTNQYTQFLRGAAHRLRELAEHAADISPELRRFADDLDRLAAELSADGAEAA